jgi:hypothetical protein
VVRDDSTGSFRGHAIDKEEIAVTLQYISLVAQNVLKIAASSCSPVSVCASLLLLLLLTCSFCCSVGSNCINISAATYVVVRPVGFIARMNSTRN